MRTKPEDGEEDKNQHPLSLFISR